MSSGVPIRSTAAPAHWLLDLEIAGVVYRFADVDLVVPDGSVEYPYLSGLGDLAITVSEGPTTAAITLEPYAGTVSWWELAARGAELEAGTATLRAWYEGTQLSDAVAYALGAVVEPEYGADDEPLTFSIDSSRWDRTDTVPPAEAVVDPTTWPITTTPFALATDPDAIGAAYPRIYGRPGRGGIDIWGVYSFPAPASPAYVGEWGDGAHIINDSLLVIADTPVAATSVLVTDVSGGYNPGPRPGNTPALISDTYPVITVADLRGRQVAAVRRGSDARRVRFIAGNEYWVSWGDDGGGRLDPRTGNEIRGAGDVISDLLLSAGIAHDRGRQAAANARLNALTLDCAISEPTEPEAWIEGQIGGLVPLLRRENVEGIWYELWRYDAGLGDAEAYLCGDPPDEQGSPGLPVTRTSTLRRSDVRAVENDITLDYLRCKQGYARTLRLRPTTAPTLADRELGSQVCTISAGRYGERPSKVQTAIIAEDGAAIVALQLRAQWLALPRRSFSVEGGPELATLAPNSVVVYSEAAVGLDRVLALVRAVEIRLDTVALAIELLDAPSYRGA
jgi:hypothetical protein